jgi:hypothetical protein
MNKSETRPIVKTKNGMFLVNVEQMPTEMKNNFVQDWYYETVSVDKNFGNTFEYVGNMFDMHMKNGTIEEITDPIDASTNPIDASTNPIDASTDPIDASTNPIDASTNPIDASINPIDT